MKLIKIDDKSGIPLLGSIAFGIIDRGSNLIQIRPTTCCNLKCIFCSTSANDNIHPVNYEVDPDYLIQEINKIIVQKNCDEIEANIDSVGEPLSYPKLEDLIKKLSKIKEIKFISMQTNGTLLTKDLIKKLDKAGLNRINLSIHSLNSNFAKELSGTSSYSLSNILKIIKDIKSSNIELWLTPVYIPNINDKDIEDLVRFSKENNIRMGIQKYEVYKYSRKVKRAKAQNYYKFYRFLTNLEQKYDIKLKIGPSDFKVKRTKKLPLTFEKGQITRVLLKAPGWYPNQVIGVSNDKCITIEGLSEFKLNQDIKVKILQNKNNIYLAKKA